MNQANRALQAIVVVTTSLHCLQSNAQFTPQLSAHNADIEFGLIANENGICRMNERGHLIGLGGQSCLGSGSQAIFDVYGWAGAVIQIEATGSSSQGLSFSPKLAGPNTRVIPANGKTYIVVAGDLTLMNARSGLHSLNYLLSVHYE